MTLLLSVVTWLLVLSLVAGLCVAARTGDIAQLGHEPGPVGQGRTASPLWVPVEQAEIAAHTNLRPVGAAQSGAPLLQSDGVAA